MVGSGLYEPGLLPELSPFPRNGKFGIPKVLPEPQPVYDWWESGNRPFAAWTGIEYVVGRRKHSEPIDWIAVEKEYRLGQCSMRQIARRFNIQTSAISRRVKREAWVQDKSLEVWSLSEARLVVSAAEREAATLKATPTDVDIEVAAVARTNALLGHRMELAQARRIGNALLAQLEAWTPHEIESDARERGLYFSAAPPITEMRADQARFATLAERAKIFGTLVTALCKVIGMEREAFGLRTENGAGHERFTVIVRDFTGKPNAQWNRAVD